MTPMGGGMEEELTEDQKAFRAAMTANAGVIAEAIRKADGSIVDGMFEAYGHSTWKPARPPSSDFSAWGDWEVWEHQEFKDGVLVRTGCWGAWNAVTGLDFWFGDKQAKSARWQAEMMAVHSNAGKKTRVVFASGAFCGSSLTFKKADAEISKTVALVEKAWSKSEA